MKVFALGSAGIEISDSFMIGDKPDALPQPVWADRVSSAGNIADWPSRGHEDGLKKFAAVRDDFQIPVALRPLCVLNNFIAN